LSTLNYCTLKTGNRLAYRQDNADAPGTGIFWLGGYKSDMEGTKAEALSAAARAAKRPCLRFDYSGHGRSKGEFADFTVSDWLSDALTMFLKIAKGPQIIAGSSMGGYIALLLARALQHSHRDELQRIKGMVLIAPAADMTEALLWGKLDEAARSEILSRGQWPMPSVYGEGYVITRKLIEDGRQHLILDQGTAVDFPVRILHGENDPDVPWQHGLKLFNSLTAEDASFTLIKHGDHRLSSARDIATIVDTVEALIKDRR
jgi:pimeloyl-ACP methyl ester carboxylesterase